MPKFDGYQFTQPKKREKTMLAILKGLSYQAAWNANSEV
mgnify:CR=1 FL=1